MSDTSFPTVPSTQYAYSLTEYMDDQGRRVIWRKPAIGTLPPDFAEYTGVSQVIIKTHTPMGPVEQPSPYRFQILGAVTIEDAFARWDLCAREAGKDHIEAIRQEVSRRESNLVIPGADQARKILEL